LTEFQALCGFKSAEQSAGEFDAMGLPWWASSLRQDGIAVTMTAMLELDRAGAAPDIREASKTSPLAKSLSALHGNDPGVLVALLLHAVTLQPGEALYLPAGNVHAYLHGTGVELMANSDNVLRGGLTTKNVDVAELMAVADVKPRPVDIIGPDANGVYPSPAPEFELVRAGHGQVRGPAIALCVSGAFGLHGDNDRDQLGHGESVFVGHDENVEFHADGVAFVARVPD
jgi:mannose-6-phosphate isomerase